MLELYTASCKTKLLQQTLFKENSSKVKKDKIYEMYDTSFYCTYKLMDSDEDKNYMYQLQLLDAFGLKKYNDDKINEEITSIHNKIKECSQFKEICKACNENENFKDFKMDEIIMLICFFSFDTFDLFHKCLVDFFTHGYILEDATTNMMNAFSNVNKPN